MNKILCYVIFFLFFCSSSSVFSKTLCEAVEEYADGAEIENENIANEENLLAFTNVTITGLYSPLLIKDNKKGVWVRPYVSYDRVNVGGGENTDLTMYGNLVGYDTELKSLKNGWQAIYAGYVGYRGNTQHYKGEVISGNSGLAGAAVTLYKKSFFTFLTADVGAGSASTNFSQNIANINTTPALRIGYNKKLKNNITIQPNYIMSYTYAKNFDAKDNNNEVLTTRPLNVIQIIPSLRAYANLKNDLKPFLIVNMVIPVMSNEKSSVNYYALPTVSLYPYVEYGGGVQKKWKNDASGFVQVLIRNGGRTGIGVLFGLKVPVGASPKPKIESSLSYGRSQALLPACGHR